MASNWDACDLQVVKRETRRAIGRVDREDAWVKVFCASSLGLVVETLLYIAIAWGVLYPYVIIRGSKYEFSVKTLPVTVLWLTCLFLFVVVVRMTFAANVGRPNREPERSLREKSVMLSVWLVATPVTVLGILSLASQSVREIGSGWLVVSFPLVVLAVGLEVAARPLLRFMVRRWLVPHAHRGRPYDRILLRLLRAAARTNRWRQKWYEPARSRYLIAEIEDIARECERSVRVSRRVPFIDADVRRELKQHFVALGATVRLHKLRIANSVKPDDFSLVSASFCAAVGSIARGETEELTAAAPEVTVISRIRLVLRKVTPFGMLLAAALILPFLPGVSDASALVNSIRVTLIVTAVLALVLPVDSPTTGRIMDTLTRSLAWKEK